MDKIAWIPAHELKRLVPDAVMDFHKEEAALWYDALEEELHEQGFNLPDDELELVKEYSADGFYFFRYNCFIVKTVKRKERFIINEMGVAYLGIKNTHKTDLDKLSMALNNLRVTVDPNGVPEEDSLKSYNHLKAYVDKMKELGVKNIKELLK